MECRDGADESDCNQFPIESCDDWWGIGMRDNTIVEIGAIQLSLLYNYNLFLYILYSTHIKLQTSQKTKFVSSPKKLWYDDVFCIPDLVQNIENTC